MQGQFADLCQQSLTCGFVLWSKVTGMTAQTFGSLGDEIIVPALDLPDCEAVKTGRSAAVIVILPRMGSRTTITFRFAVQRWT